MADTQVLQDAVVAAEDTFAALLVTRRGNRDTMTRRDFRSYNASTRADQVQISADVESANQALRDHLNGERENVIAQVISVGTLDEGNRVKGVSPSG